MKSTRLIWTLSLLLLGTAIACTGKEDTPDALMVRGLDAMYVRNDPDAAVKAFRGVLAKNAEHYGANYQLAVALDRSEKPAEALPQWQRCLAMAEAIKDEKTAGTARMRLGQPQLSPEDAAMKAGLEALYEKRDAAAAVVEFRKVLAVNPNHYGATFQLAKALDQAGKPAEARPHWERVLKMAQDSKDTATAERAAARLAARP